MAIYKVLMILNWLKYLKIRVVFFTFTKNKALKRLYLRFSPGTLGKQRVSEADQCHCSDLSGHGNLYFQRSVGSIHRTRNNKKEVQAVFTSFSCKSSLSSFLFFIF
jgi:hypothetical protein